MDSQVGNMIDLVVDANLTVDMDSMIDLLANAKSTVEIMARVRVRVRVRVRWSSCLHNFYLDSC